VVVCMGQVKAVPLAVIMFELGNTGTWCCCRFYAEDTNPFVDVDEKSHSVLLSRRLPLSNTVNSHRRYPCRHPPCHSSRYGSYPRPSRYPRRGFRVGPCFRSSLPTLISSSHFDSEGMGSDIRLIKRMIWSVRKHAC